MIPIISVIMPVYNGEKYLVEAIDSILNQTFTDFEFIILNDCSTDKTEEIIFSYNDSRIRYYKNEKNLRIVKTLNRGIALSRGIYIARMDGDDISEIDRFEKQISFMNLNSDVVLCGGGYSAINADIDFKPILEHNQLVLELTNSCAFAHPTVFIRKEILEKYDIKYECEFESAEDFRLWTQLCKYGKVANLPDKLIKYRIHLGQITKTSSKTQFQKSNKVILDFIYYLSNQNINYRYFNLKILNNLSEAFLYESIEKEINKNIILDSIYFRIRKKIYFSRAINDGGYGIIKYFTKIPLLLKYFNLLGIRFILKFTFKSFFK
jgi:glycosyltransferase involved in cell wall biosynthesis